MTPKGNGHFMDSHGPLGKTRQNKNKTTTKTQEKLYLRCWLGGQIRNEKPMKYFVAHCGFATSNMPMR